jgi:hypothetical protein
VKYKFSGLGKLKKNYASLGFLLQLLFVERVTLVIAKILLQKNLSKNLFENGAIFFDDERFREEKKTFCRKKMKNERKKILGAIFHFTFKMVERGWAGRTVQGTINVFFSLKKFLFSLLLYKIFSEPMPLFCNAFFVKNQHLTLTCTVENIGQKYWATSVIFQETPKETKRTEGENSPNLVTLN